MEVRLSVPVEGRRNKAAVLLLMGLAFAVIGGPMFFFMGLRPYLEVRDARDWTETRCRILDSEIVRDTDTDGDLQYKAAVEYRYQVGGRSFTGDRVSFSGFEFSSDFDGADAIVSRYLPGRDVPCFHDPDDPSDAVLERSTGALSLFGFLPLGFFVIGLGLTATGVARLRQSTNADGPGRREGPVRLPRHRGSGGASLLVHGGFALTFTIPPFVFWSAGAGWMERAAALFCGAIAVGLHVGFWRRLLSWAGTRAEVVAARLPCPGQSVTFDIHLRGLTPIRFARARLVGREENERIIDGESEVDHEIFFARPIAEARAPGTRARLEGRVALPEGAEPTSHGERDRVRWLVVLEVDLALWPDVTREYELEVTAREEPEA